MTGHITRHPTAGFIGTAEIARLLGLPRALSFTKRRIDLQRHHGFPPPMPHSKRPLLWRRDEVMGWIEAHGRIGSHHTPPPRQPRNIHLMAEARRA